MFMAFFLTRIKIVINKVYKEARRSLVLRQLKLNNMIKSKSWIKGLTNKEIGKAI